MMLTTIARTCDLENSPTRPACLKPQAPAKPDDFMDAFLGTWIDNRLGNEVRRHLIVLVVSIRPAGDEQDDCRLKAIRGEVSNLIDAHQGQPIPRCGVAQIIGVWGLHHLTNDAGEQAIRAAEAIVAGSSDSADIRCLLHVTAVRIAKRDADAAADAVTFAMAGGPAHTCQITTAEERILVSDAFRSACRPARLLLPVSVCDAQPRAKPTEYFALGRRTEPGADALRQCCGNADSCLPIDVQIEIDAVGDLGPVIIAAAIAGPAFTGSFLARLFELDPARLRPALEYACERGVLQELQRDGPEEFYAFRDSRLCRAAYEMVPPGLRLGLHRRAAAILQQTARQGGAMPPDLIARHHIESRNTTQSRRFLGKAAWQAITEGDADRAVAHLEEALAQDEDQPSALNRSLLQLLGVQLALTKGNGADDVFDVYQRSLATAGAAPPYLSAQEFRSLWGVQSCHLVKGEVRAALTIGNLLLRRLERNDEMNESMLGMRILTHRMHALALMLSGQLTQSLAHYAYVTNHYDAERHAILRFAYGSDQAALAFAHMAWVSAITGDTALSEIANRQARQACSSLDHPHTTAHAMAVLSVAALSLEADSEAALAARETRAIAAERGFPYWVAWADVVLAALNARRSPRAGFEQLKNTIAAYRATGAMQLCPIALAWLGRAALDDGHPEVALQVASSGLDLAAQTGCTVYRPELLRCRALALAALGKTGEAGDALEAGFAEAVKMGAGSFTRRLTRDGIKTLSGQEQILWQARYHGTL